MWQKLNIRKTQKTDFFQHTIPGKLWDALKGQRKAIHTHLLQPHIYRHARIFYTEACFACEVLVATRKGERKVKTSCTGGATRSKCKHNFKCSTRKDTDSVG